MCSFYETQCIITCSKWLNSVNNTTISKGKCTGIGSQFHGEFNTYRKVTTDSWLIFYIPYNETHLKTSLYLLICIIRCDLVATSNDKSDLMHRVIHIRLSNHLRILAQNNKYTERSQKSVDIFSHADRYSIDNIRFTVLNQQTRIILTQLSLWPFLQVYTGKSVVSKGIQGHI